MRSTGFELAQDFTLNRGIFGERSASVCKMVWPLSSFYPRPMNGTYRMSTALLGCLWTEHVCRIGETIRPYFRTYTSSL